MRSAGRRSTEPGRSSRWSASSLVNDRAQEGGDFGTGLLGLFRRERDGLGGGSGVEQGLHGSDPVGAGVSGGPFSAAYGGPVQRGAVPRRVARLEVRAPAE